MKPMSLTTSLLCFGIPTIMLLLAARFGVPFLTNHLGTPAVVSWFISGGLLVLLPLFVVSLVAYRLEGNENSLAAFCRRFRLKPMTKQDWLWTVGSVIFILLSSALLLLFARWLTSTTNLPPFKTSPPFLEIQPLSRDQMWIFLAWLPFFFFNIFGEELWWRGYIQPRQELKHGKYTWIVQGLLWGMLHISFGWSIILLLIPILFCLPWVVQKRQNTWIAILIHGITNGLGFISASLGLVPA